MRVLNKQHWTPALQVRLLDNEPTTYYMQPVDAYIDERVTWCKQNLPKGLWYAYREFGWKIFAFKADADLTAFKLRWV